MVYVVSVARFLNTQLKTLFLTIRAMILYPPIHKRVLALFVFSQVGYHAASELAKHFVAGRGCGLKNTIRYKTRLDEILQKDLTGKNE